MTLDDLNDEELRRLHARVRRSIDRGHPLNEEVRRYGIRDLSSLRRWISRIESMLDERGQGYRSLAGR